MSASHNFPAIQTKISSHRFLPFVHQVNGGQLKDNMQQKLPVGTRQGFGRSQDFLTL
jgi:hypothetical protein